jgi:hypothetical protein
MEENTTIQESEEQQAVSPTILDTVSNLATSVLQIAQENVVGRAQEFVDDVLAQAQVAATEVLQNAVVLFIIVLLGIIGFVFAITGLSLWIGDISGLGVWFGFLIVGLVVLIVALIAGLSQKNKMSQ